MVLKVIEKFKRDNESNVETGLKPLEPIDLDKRFTQAGYVLDTETIANIYEWIIESN